ncbi:MULTISPECIES: DUF2269 family protein [unclassified Pseudomonas]|uniref:DUF2269 domain-containing protein n=1 Tax=unclassified Pseudomonas TaxID=196821 RepID=UPI0002A26872|nr:MULTISPECIES: DUF2269 family protein [unclassified Pseudomonas]MBB1608575.1 hypothetical protein [Pseudomonas sp. UMC76]MBB1637266.1 hypothetical protein [Pseudomonas sp. UME83]NTX91164.1 DUF2269 domain-containing protein [Pseudomonas sp. UMA643]NTY19665.1 DUF2269 domain-containing protein [Pseudomonas sp. UMC3103]NTY24395.1 DUF2269 domain-containing protein [Pseudomonas sp. UMA603]
MEIYQSLKILHGVAVAVPLLAIAGLAWYGWRSWRGGDAGVLARALLRIGLAAWVLVAGSVVSLPLTGWQMVHRAGFPLGQTWLLASACLLILVAIFWLLFTSRLWRIRALAVSARDSGEPLAERVVRELRFGAAFFALALLSWLAILALMLAKPL